MGYQQIDPLAVFSLSGVFWRGVLQMVNENHRLKVECLVHCREGHQQVDGAQGYTEEGMEEGRNQRVSDWIATGNVLAV